MPAASYYTIPGAESIVPEYLKFPFLPSWEALARDSGKSFGEDSIMTVFTANAAVLAQILVYNLFKGGDSKGNIAPKGRLSNSVRIGRLAATGFFHKGFFNRFQHPISR